MYFEGIYPKKRSYQKISRKIFTIFTIKIGHFKDGTIVFVYYKHSILAARIRKWAKTRDAQNFIYVTQF